MLEIESIVDYVGVMEVLKFVTLNGRWKKLCPEVVND